MGELLGDMDKQGPGEYKRLRDATVPPSLRELDIEKTQSHRYQRIVIFSRSRPPSRHFPGPNQKAFQSVQPQ